MTNANVTKMTKTEKTYAIVTKEIQDHYIYRSVGTSFPVDSLTERGVPLFIGHGWIEYIPLRYFGKYVDRTTVYTTTNENGKLIKRRTVVDKDVTKKWLNHWKKLGVKNI